MPLTNIAPNDFYPPSPDSSVGANAGQYDLGNLGYCLFDPEATRGVAISPPSQPFFWDTRGMKSPRDSIIKPIGANNRSAYMAGKGLQKPAGPIGGPLVANAGVSLFKWLMKDVFFTGNDKAGTASPDTISGQQNNANAGTTKITFSAPSVARYRPGMPVMVDCTSDGKIQATSVLAVVQDMTVNTVAVTGPPAYSYNRVLTITIPYTNATLTGLKVCLLTCTRYRTNVSDLANPTHTIEHVYGGNYGDVYAGCVGSKLTLSVDKEIWSQTWDVIGTQPVAVDAHSGVAPFSSTANQLKDFLQLMPGSLSALVVAQDDAATGTAALGLKSNWENCSIEIDDGVITLDRGGRSAHNAVGGHSLVTCKYKYDNTAMRRVERDDFINAVSWRKTSSIMMQALLPAMNPVSGAISGVTGMTFHIPAAIFEMDDNTDALGAVESIDVTRRASHVASQPVWGDWSQYLSTGNWQVTANGTGTVADASYGLPFFEAYVVSTATAAP